MKIFPPGACGGGAAPASVNLGPHHIWESIIARKLRFYTHSGRSSALFGNDNFSGRGRPGGRSAPGVNLGPPCISETIGAKNLKFYIHLDGPDTLFYYDNFSEGVWGRRTFPKRKFFRQGSVA